MSEIDQLANRLRPHYQRFLGGLGDDVLLTGHSHQAWPDVSRAAQLEAWDAAAAQIDSKWDRIFGEVLPALQRAIAARIGSDRPADLAVAQNTHELVYRLLSCFGATPSVLTTDAEFHSLSRQLSRLEEDGAKILRLDATTEDLADRLIDALSDAQPSLLALSYVFFTTSRVLVELPRVLDAASDAGVPVLVDAYHAFNTLELDVARWPGTVFIVGGGYKYAQCGEGVCWMLLPQDASAFRPRHTGWFADFGSLADGSDRVQYGPGGQRFGGATFDPTSLYRAVRVFEWMQEIGLSPATLRAQSVLQTARTIDRYDQLDLAGAGLELATPRAAAERGAFVSLRHHDAGEIATRLAAAGVRVDTRGPYLRIGPAPYTTEAEIDRGLDTLRAVLG